MARLWRRISFVSILSIVVMGLVVPPLGAKTAEPTILTRAWYWEQAMVREETLPTGEKVTIETPNPFCPGAPGQLGAPEQACAEGRLPVEIQQGDYETPNKISAVAFDMSLVPVGSKVSKFTATFLEAKPGCYDNNDEGSDPNWCETTEPVNIDGKELRACLIADFLGEGDSRPYNEVPTYQCDAKSPVAKRKEVTTKDGETEHEWTFDLTGFAQEWVTEFTTNTSIVITGNPPKEAGSDSWRVVLVGPKAPEGKVGVETKIDFVPGEIEPPPTVGTTGTTGTGSVSTGTGTVSTTGSSGSVPAIGSSSGAGGTIGGDTATTPTDAAAGAAPTLAAAGAEETPQGIPGYVWLALLVGIIAWSVFRSVVLENSKGIRPDGVLAQIQRINAENGGSAAAAAAAAEPSSSSDFMSFIKGAPGSLLNKLKLTRKG